VDYTRSPLGFRIRKVARYTALYGPRRTLVKVRGQYHMRSQGGGGREPGSRGRRSDAHVGILGCGNFAFSTVAYYLRHNAGAVVRGVMDIELARARSLARAYRAHYATADASRVIEDPAIDLVYLTSNHASHAEYAIAALEAGKHVHIEKPHVVSEDQLDRLCAAMAGSEGRARLGFNRPDSGLGQQIRRLLDAEEGAMMLNWFVAGHEIPPDHWYFREEEGGRVLGNLCHWTDFVLRTVPPEGRFPLEIHPARAAKADADIAVSYVFGDGSIAAITFSAKGHAFEGVREHLSAHRGGTLLALSDFKELRADVLEHRENTTLRFRDHGHENAVMTSYRMSTPGGGSTPGLDVDYVRDTGRLFLETRRALEEGEVKVLEGSAVKGVAHPTP